MKKNRNSPLIRGGRGVAKKFIFSAVLSVFFISPVVAAEVPANIPTAPPAPELPGVERPTVEEIFPETEPAVIVEEIPAAEESEEVSEYTVSDDKVSRNSMFLWAFVIAVVLGAISSKGGKKSSEKNTTVTKNYDGDV